MFRMRGMLASASAVAVTSSVLITIVATPVATAADSVVVEGESMTMSPFYAGSTARDSAASAGTARVVGWTSTLTKNVTLPASGTVVVRAKGRQCNGAPIMTVKVDGALVGTHTVSATAWTDFKSPAKITAGAHTIVVAFTNQNRTFACIRELSVDAVTVVPSVVATTTTTKPPTTTTTTKPPTSTTTTTTTKPPTTTPTTTSTPGPVTVAPKANLPGWTHIFADDFTRAAPVGSWDNGTDPEKIVYTGAQGQQWRTYPSFYLDTYDKRPYRPAEVLSVSDGMLKFFLHNVQGKPAGANPSPLLANGSQYQTYGRYSARMKVDTLNLSEYHIAWLLWPQSEKWPDDGEIDFPEAQIDAEVGAFHHYARPSGGQDLAYTGVMFDNWHVYTIEWSPGRVRCLIDDVVVLESTKYVPNKPMRWQLQTETQGNGTHQGNVLVDWVSAWSYAGNP